jgi:radical SAM protein with 4Fe4S-binding SPASM domain
MRRMRRLRRRSMLNLHDLANRKFQYEQSSHLLLQWHITDRCNLRCKHCYQKTYSGSEPSYSELLYVVNQFKDLLKIKRKKDNIPIRGQITVTGGEPFVRSDFLDLLKVFSENQKYFTFAILTNGIYIDSDMALHLKHLNPKFVQVSLEGTKETHDDIRGEGSYNRTISALKYLVEEKIRTMISFTAHKGNYREFPDVARLGCKIGVSKVWADRLIPCGSGLGLKDQSLSSKETKEFFEIMHKVKGEIQNKWFNKTHITMKRALQFLKDGGRPYSCSAGDTLITIMPNGDLYPCRRMPIRVGNVQEGPLHKLYYETELFRALRDRDRISKGCENCFYSRLCRGGLKCLSYAVSNDQFTAEPGCWLKGFERNEINRWGESWCQGTL